MFDAVVGVVGEGVVSAAEEGAVGQVGCSALLPGGEVGAFAGGGGPVAGLHGAGAVLGQQHREALLLGEQAGSAAQVEDLARGAEDGGDEPVSGGEPSGLAGADRLAGVEVGGL